VDYTILGHQGGGDVRLVNINIKTVFLAYVFRSPFGGDGWIVSINNMKI
jgi:hypothetical protein